jgi:hypothetical protein
MKGMLILALLWMISLGLPSQVSADASPPLYPPGSAVLPAGQTMVQMVAETVEITIVEPSGEPARADFEARFTMHNQGEATEQMDVRFPLANFDADAPIASFAASVDGRRVPVHETEEPFELGDPSVLLWAAFPVRFDPGADVAITVTYSTGLSGWAWNPDESDFLDPYSPDLASVYYTLETGAGWYGTIESGIFVLRLPYEANSANVSYPYTPSLSGPIFVDDEARWESTELEPTWQDNLTISFVWPEEWRWILDLEAQWDQNPEDISVAIELAGAYLAAGIDPWSEGYAGEAYCSLSEEVIRQTLVYNPSADELLDALASISSYCPEVAAPPGLATPTRTPTLVPTFAYPRPPTFDPSSASTAAAVAALPPTAQPQASTPPPAPVREPEGSSAGLGALVAAGIGIALVLALAGIRSMRASR